MKKKTPHPQSVPSGTNAKPASTPINIPAQVHLTQRLMLLMVSAKAYSERLAMLGVDVSRTNLAGMRLDLHQLLDHIEVLDRIVAAGGVIINGKKALEALEAAVAAPSTSPAA